MNVYDFAAARAIRPPRTAHPDDSRPGMDNVYEIESARRMSGAHIPRDVHEEMEAAAALYDLLQDEGRQIRYTRLGGGRVAAHMCDLDGNVVRPLTLHEAIDPAYGPDTAA
jgi:hypothetical protein